MTGQNHRQEAVLSRLGFPLFVYVSFHCMHGQRTTLWHCVSSSTFRWILGIEFRLSGLYGKQLDKLSHLASLLFHLHLHYMADDGETPGTHLPPAC